MKVGLFFGSFEGGGAERMMVNLAKGLAEKSIDVTVYVVNCTGPYLNEVPENIPIKSFDAKYGVKSIIPKIRKVLKKDGLTAFISTQMHINSAVGIASIGLKIKPKIIFREANTPSKIINSRIEGQIYKWCYSFADHFVAVSMGVKQDMVKYFSLVESKVSVIYNPAIDKSIYDKMNEEVDHPWFIDSAIPVIIGVGRFAPQKAFEDLVDAFIFVRKQRAVRLVILGKKNEGSDYFKMIQKKINDSGFRDDIALLGFVDNPFKYLKRADIFVLSSKFEGLPGVLIQAMACGCPVVSTDCPSGPREILNNGEFGKLTNIGEHGELGKAIIETLKSDPNKGKLEQRASFFSVDNSSKSYLELIQELNS